MTMRRRTLPSWFPRFAAVCLATALSLTVVPLQAAPPQSDSLPGKFIVHEWGTFTSFSGSDGVNLEFRPLESNDLPRFVVKPGRRAVGPESFLKNDFVARQRMETPVTYFYTDEPRTVNVRVDFPQGMLSEWYPVVKSYHAGKDDAKQTVVGGAYLDWGAVRLTPAAEFASVRVRGPNNQPVPAWLPAVPQNDHYGQARATDSAIVETLDPSGNSHFEKFLFYRGLGNYDLPLKLAALGKEQFQIANTSGEASGAMLLVRIDGSHVRFTWIAPIAPSSTIEATLPKSESTVGQLAEAMVGDLVAAGLYEKEALAMVSTWRGSWFGENGTRLLCLLPGKFTDQLLPLTIDPAPDACVRVMVGRLETLTPEDCERLDGAVSRDEPRALESLGRFAEPAVAYLISQSNDASQRAKLEEVLNGLRTTN
jgi:hypothetical protein